MQYKWLNKGNNNNFILFMNGWGMDETSVNKLNCENYDVLMAYDYRKLDNYINELDLSEYKNKYLIAWSMGVYVCGLYSKILNDFTKKVAIAGSQKIIDNKFGIPQKIYDCTIKYFNKESADKFIYNMFPENKNIIKINRNYQELKEELIAIKNIKVGTEIQYDKVIIPINDLIVPCKNQKAYWDNTSAEIIEADAPHYIFDKFSSWRELL